MRFDRRRFVQIGAAGALGTLAGCRDGGQKDPPPTSAPTTTAPASASAGAELQVDFEGFYIVEGNGSNTKVRMIDGPAVGVPTHTLELRALKSAIDEAQSSAPDSTQTVGTDVRWIFNLAGKDVAMPKADSGPDNLGADETSGEDSLEKPSSDGGWHSLKRLPDLKQLCGATAVTNMAAVASTVFLKHGHLTVVKPAGVGPGAVWKFVKVADNTEISPPGHKALSNRVRYTRSNNGNQLVIAIGTGPSAKKIVFKQGVTTQVMISNTMPSAGPCPAPCTPNMNHFSAFLLVVNKTFDSKAELVSFVPPGGGNADPDYCPGGRC